MGYVYRLFSLLFAEFIRNPRSIKDFHINGESSNVSKINFVHSVSREKIRKFSRIEFIFTKSQNNRTHSSKKLLHFNSFL